MYNKLSCCENIQTDHTLQAIGVANGKSKTRRDAKTGILKSKTETEKFSDLIEKHVIM